jgi:hypothetical protein
MGSLQAQTDTWDANGFRPATADEVAEMTGRYEPQILVERIVPKDPYAAWLEQREAAREHEERPRVRWVHRQRGGDGRAIVARRL